MKFGRRAQEESESIPLAPLIDIVFLTLVFFMTTAVYSTLESEVDIQLPTASSAKDSARARGEIYINIRDDGQIVLSNREVTLPELQSTLKRVAELYPGGAVIIRGDRNTPYGRVIAVLDCCKNADIPNVSFSALREEPKEAS